MVCIAPGLVYGRKAWTWTGFVGPFVSSSSLLLSLSLLRRPLTEKDKVDEMTRKCQFAGRNDVLSKDERSGRLPVVEQQGGRAVGGQAVEGAILLWEISTGGKRGRKSTAVSTKGRPMQTSLPPSLSPRTALLPSFLSLSRCAGTKPCLVVRWSPVP